MKNLINFFIHRPITVFMIIIAVFMGCILSLMSIPLDILPEIHLPQITIETSYPGMNANDVRIAVTIPLEDAMSSVKGLQRIKSISRDGVSLISLDFSWGTELSHAAALVRETIDLVYPGLPHGIIKPLVISGSIGEEPHAIIAVRSKTGDNSFARYMAEYELKSRFRKLDGTGQVILLGGVTEEARIRINSERLVSRGYNADDFVSLITPEIIDIPAGNIREGNHELTVVSQGRPQSIEELASLILPAAINPLAINDIGYVEKEYAVQKSSFLFQNIEQIALEVYKRPGSDPIKLSRDIKKVIKESSYYFERDLELFLVYDSSDLIIQSIRNLVISIIIGASAVGLILAFFIKSIKTSLFAALALPISTAAAIIVLKLSGRSLNTMSLTGIAMGIGLVSDLSVIVLDLFNRNLKPGVKTNAAILGQLCISVSNSSFAGTITTVIVFLPIIFFPGPLGILFGDLAISLITSVVFGWIYSQFLLPAIFLFFNNSKLNLINFNLKFININTHKNPVDFFKPFLIKSIRQPLHLPVCVVIFSLISFFLLFNRPMHFYIPEQTNEVQIVLDFPPGINIEAIIDKGLSYSNEISHIDDIEIFFARIGAEDEDINPRIDPDYRRERIVFRCFLINGANKHTAIRNINSILSEYSAMIVDVSDVSDINIFVGSPLDKTSKILGLSSSFTLMINGDYDTIEQSSNALIASLSSSIGSMLNTINLRPSETRPELRFIPDREVNSYLGITADKIAYALYTATEGIVSGTMEIDGRPLDIRVIGDNTFISQKNLEALPLALQKGRENFIKNVFLGSLGQLERRESKAILARHDRTDVLYLDLLPNPGKEKELNAFLSNNLNDYTRVDDSVFTKYRSILYITLIIVILLLYLTMAAQFESLKLPLILMLSIPFGLTGSGLLLFLTGISLDLGSVLGLIVLFGLSVNNGIIIYEAGVENLIKGFKPALAVYKGTIDRFRAMLISTLTTIFGLVPLLFSSGVSQRSMAITMLGGLLVSALLTFFILPSILIILFNKKQVNHD